MLDIATGRKCRGVRVAAQSCILKQPRRLQHLDVVLESSYTSTEEGPFSLKMLLRHRLLSLVQRIRRPWKPDDINSNPHPPAGGVNVGLQPWARFGPCSSES